MAIEFLDRHAEVERWVLHFSQLLGLESEDVLVTTSRTLFERYLERRVSSSPGGAYIFLAKRKKHLVWIHVARLNPAEPRAIELVVAEELIHLRDWIDGDKRRHAKHGYDRIAFRVAELTGASLAEIRNCMLPPKQRPYRWVYRCPGCHRIVYRRRRGVWSCSQCAPRFDRRFVLELVAEIDAA